MNKLLTLIVFSTLFSGSLFAQDKAAEGKAIRNLMVDTWTDAYQNQDIATLDNLLADEFQLIDASGNVFKKQDEIQYLKDSKPAYDSFDFNVGNIEIFSNLTSIVSGLGILKGTDDQGKYQTTYHSSNVLIKSDGKWKVVSSHVSGIQKQYFEKN